MRRGCGLGRGGRWAGELCGDRFAGILCVDKTHGCLACGLELLAPAGQHGYCFSAGLAQGPGGS